MALCRKLTTNRVDEIAQGRVLSGADALKNGLVDELGGLQQAIVVAAKEAKLGTNYAVAEFPKPKGLGRNNCPKVYRTDRSGRWRGATWRAGDLGK